MPSYSITTKLFKNSWFYLSFHLFTFTWRYSSWLSVRNLAPLASPLVSERFQVRARRQMVNLLYPLGGWWYDTSLFTAKAQKHIRHSPQTRHSAAAFSLSASSCERHQSVLFCWPFSNLRLYKAAPADTNFMSGSSLEGSSLLKKRRTKSNSDSKHAAGRVCFKAFISHIYSCLKRMKK